MKDCELCGKVARMYCESDQASLCWDCDEKVHGANFLVARHSRSLLCHVCQSSTPWKASGPKLTPTVSVCEGCVDIHSRSICDAESEVAVDDEEEVDDDDDDGGDDSGRDYSDGEEEDGDEDGENQVVPWSCNLSPPPPPSSSSSSEDDEEISTAVSTLKRERENANADSDVIALVFSIFIHGVQFFFFLPKRNHLSVFSYSFLFDNDSLQFFRSFCFFIFFFCFAIFQKY